MRVGSRRNYKHWVTAAARTVENLSSLHDDDEVGGGDDDDNDDDVKAFWEARRIMNYYKFWGPPGPNVRKAEF